MTAGWVWRGLRTVMLSAQVCPKTAEMAASITCSGGGSAA